MNYASREIADKGTVRGKPHGSLYGNTIQNGPNTQPIGMVTDPPPTVHYCACTRKKHDIGVHAKKTSSKWLILQAEIILIQFSTHQQQAPEHPPTQGLMLRSYVTLLLEPVQRKAPGNVGNTGARGKKVICYNCRGEGHVARQCKEPKRKMDSQYFKDKALLMEAKEKGDVLDAEAEAFLADWKCTAP
ncbi:retrovirus-related pol polyprotein from transposon TNT 1-94 [Tanacetum coccineum]